MFHGFDTDPTMLRIGTMNMMLHGVANPAIDYKDSLSKHNNDKGLYTLVLANPPFKGSLDSETVEDSLLRITKTRKTELLFLALFLRILKTGGRAAVIVPVDSEGDTNSENENNSEQENFLYMILPVRLKA